MFRSPRAVIIRRIIKIEYTVCTNLLAPRLFYLAYIVSYSCVISFFVTVVTVNEMEQSKTDRNLPVEMVDHDKSR